MFLRKCHTAESKPRHGCLPKSDKKMCNGASMVCSKNCLSIWFMSALVLLLADLAKTPFVITLQASSSMSCRHNALCKHIPHAVVIAMYMSVFVCSWQ